MPLGITWRLLRISAYPKLGYKLRMKKHTSACQSFKQFKYEDWVTSQSPWRIQEVDRPILDSSTPRVKITERQRGSTTFRIIYISIYMDPIAIFIGTLRWIYFSDLPRIACIGPSKRRQNAAEAHFLRAKVLDEGRYPINPSPLRSSRSP